MSTQITESLVCEVTQRALGNMYTAVVVDSSETVLNELFAEPHMRRDAIIELLMANHDEVSATDVEEILAPFGGAQADVALENVIELYIEAGVDIDVYLGSHAIDAGPARLYSTFTEYGDGTSFVEHHSTKEDRLQELRDRVAGLITGFDTAEEITATATETSCQKFIESQLASTNGRVILFETLRQSDGVYLSEI
jgi:hypothetical protein